MQRLLAIGVALLVGGGLAAALLLTDGASTPGVDRVSSVRPSVPAPAAPTRGCAQRTLGDLPDVRGSDLEVVVGPLSLGALPRAYREMADRVRSGTLEGIVPLKAMVLLDAGERVTLVVPSAQRRWLRLVYQFPFNRKGEDAIRLEACPRTSPTGERRPAVTQFTGGFLVDSDRAPRLARCAALDVWIDGEPGPTRTRLFNPPPGSCPGAS